MGGRGRVLIEWGQKSSRPEAKVRGQGPPGSGRAQPWAEGL